MAITIAAALLCVSGTAGTYALLTASAPTATSASVLTSGTADLTLSSLTLPTSALYPGATVYAPVTATNIGDVPLALAVNGLTAPSNTAANAFSNSLVVGVSPSASASACAGGTESPTWTGSFGTATAALIGASVRVGASQALCVSVSLPLNAPAASQGQSASGFKLRLTGTQD